MARAPVPADDRQIPKANPLPPPPPVNPGIAPEIQAEASCAIAMTLSAIFAQLSNDNINTMLLMSEKQNLEESQTDVKKVHSKQESGPHGGKFPVIEARQKRTTDETDKKYKSICGKLEERQATLKTNCDKIATKIVPDILRGCAKMLSPKEDTKSKEDFDRLSKRCNALEAELEEQKKSLHSVRDATNNLLTLSHSQMSNSKSVTEGQESKLEEVRKQCSELGQRQVANESRLQRTEDILGNHSKVEGKVNELASTLSKLKSQQDKAEEKAVQQKSKFEEDFNYFKIQVEKQLSDRKSATPQPHIQQKLDDVAKLSDRVDILEASSKANSAVVETLKSDKSTSINSLKKNLNILLSDQDSDSKKFDSLVGGLKEVKDTAAATAELLAKTSEEIQAVKDRVNSSTDKQSKALETIKERISFLGKTTNRSSPNIESHGVKNLAGELATVKKDIERLKTQSKELREVQRSATSVAAQPPQKSIMSDFEAAIEELKLSIEVQFDGLEEGFGGEVNRLKKEVKDDIVQLREDINAQTLDTKVQDLEGRVNQFHTQLNSLWIEQGQKFNSIDNSIVHLKASCQANGHAVTNLDSRYNNITTVDIYKGMSDAFAQDMFPKVDQLYELVHLLQVRTRALESAGPGSNVESTLRTLGEIQLRLGHVESTSQANSSEIEEYRKDVKKDLDTYKDLMSRQYAKLASRVNVIPAKNGDSGSFGVNGSKKRLHTESPNPLPSLSNGQSKRARLADSEEQDDLD